MKSFEEFILQFQEREEIDERMQPSCHFDTYTDEGKKKKKRKHAEDEEGKAPKTGHEMIDPDTGFEDPLKGYPEQKRIY